MKLSGKSIPMAFVLGGFCLSGARSGHTEKNAFFRDQSKQGDTKRKYHHRIGDKCFEFP